MQHNDSYCEFSPANNSARTQFQTQAYPFTDLHLLKLVRVVDIAYKNQSIYIISQSAQLVIPKHLTQEEQSLLDLYANLSPECNALLVMSHDPLVQH